MKTLLAAAAISLLAPVALPFSAPAVAAPASPADQKAASTFVSNLAGKAFAVLRDKSLSKAQARAEFRKLLRGNFAVDEIGMRLVRRYRTTLTPAQLDAYRKALPDFIVNTYSDRLYDFAAAKVTVVRTAPRGSNGNVDVYTKITDPKGGRPIDAIWTVKQGAQPLISNITVNGVNVALTQEQDFASYINRNGFDALVGFMTKAQ